MTSDEIEAMIYPLLRNGYDIDDIMKAIEEYANAVNDDYHCEDCTPSFTPKGERGI